MIIGSLTLLTCFHDIGTACVLFSDNFSMRFFVECIAAPHLISFFRYMFASYFFMTHPCFVLRFLVISNKFSSLCKNLSKEISMDMFTSFSALFTGHNIISACDLSCLFCDLYIHRLPLCPDFDFLAGVMFICVWSAFRLVIHFHTDAFMLM